MTLVPGASRFLNQATLSALQGSTFQAPTLLGESTLGLSLLELGRSTLPDNGIGISRQARILNNQQLNSSAASFNQLFSLGAGSATVESAVAQIKGLQATVPVSRKVDVAEDLGGINPQEDTGTTVDETA